MMGGNKSAILQVTLFVAGTGLVIFGSQLATRSTAVYPTSQDPQTNPSKQDCDIDGNLKRSEDCPAETIVKQYKDKYGVTVVLRGGVYWQVISGEYVNKKYGYRVVLPEGIQALCSPPPMPWHGFFVDLEDKLKQPADMSANHGGVAWANWDVGVYVEGSYNAALYTSPDDAAIAALHYYKKQHPADLTILNQQRTKLRRLPAVRYVVQFVDAKSGETMIAEELVALRGDEESEIIYKVGLATTSSRYNEGEKILSRIVRELRFTRIE